MKLSKLRTGAVLRRGFTLVELMVVIAIIGLLASVLATAVLPKMRKASRELDVKRMKDMYDEVQIAMMSETNRGKMRRDIIAKRQGYEFWEGMFRTGILTSDVLPKLVSIGGQDVKADSRWLDTDDGRLPLDACSWTAPLGSEWFAVMSARGSARRVAMSYNSRNWHNFVDDGPLCMWSDGEMPIYTSIDLLKEWGYDISKEQWEDPGSTLFGRVKPFDGVWD
ncbi:MAG: type II secretion system protein [Planctomycetes bacterium]|nr:type II secretion system protein [Planctomycetota bacterium]